MQNSGNNFLKGLVEVGRNELKWAEVRNDQNFCQYGLKWVKVGYSGLTQVEVVKIKFTNEKNMGYSPNCVQNY